MDPYSIGLEQSSLEEYLENWYQWYNHAPYIVKNPTFALITNPLRYLEFHDVVRSFKNHPSRFQVSYYSVREWVTISAKNLDEFDVHTMGTLATHIIPGPLVLFLKSNRAKGPSEIAFTRKEMHVLSFFARIPTYQRDDFDTSRFDNIKGTIYGILPKE